MNSEVFIRISTIIIALIGAIITYIIVPYVKNKTTAEQYRNIQFWVSVAVNAAEQIFSQPNMGEQKKQYVIDFLKKIGIEISMEQLDMLIEAAVHELNQKKELLLIN